MSRERDLDFKVSETRSQYLKLRFHKGIIGIYLCCGGFIQEFRVQGSLEATQIQQKGTIATAGLGFRV